MFYLGVDPAMTGAAILLSDRREAVAGFFWKPRAASGSQVWDLTFAYRRGLGGGIELGSPWWSSRATLSTFGRIGERIREILQEVGASPYGLAGENAVVGRGVDTSIAIARNVGRILGPLEASASGLEATWVTATKWRSALLRLPPRTKREEAKEQSRKWMPLRVQGLQDLVRLLGDADDITDAAGVAEWLALQTMDPSLSSKPSQRRSRPRLPKSSVPGAPTAKSRGRRGA